MKLSVSPRLNGNKLKASLASNESFKRNTIGHSGRKKDQELKVNDDLSSAAPDYVSQAVSVYKKSLPSPKIFNRQS